MSRDIKAGGAFVEFFSKGKAGLMKDLQAVQMGLKAFGVAASAVAAVGGTIAAGLGAAFLKFAEMGDDLTDSANRIGITTDRLQELTYAASQSGAKMEDVERAMLMAQRKGLDFEKVARAIGKMEDPMKRNQAAFAAFGKSGARIAPMLADLDKLSANARKLGLVFRPEDVAAGGKMSDMLGTIKAQIEALVFTTGAALAPLMEGVFVVTQNLLAEVIKTVKGIEDAIIAANFGLAFDIAWTGALLSFEKFRAEMFLQLTVLGAEFGVAIANAFKEAMAGVFAGGDLTALKVKLTELTVKTLNPTANAERLQKELDRLINQAAREREKRGYLMPGLTQPPIPAAARSGAQSGQFGAFNAAIASMAGRTGQLTQDKQLKVLEGIEDDIAVIRKKAEEGGLVFA